MSLQRMTLCTMEEIEGRPGFQWCPVCQRQRFWPQEQKSPKPMPANYRRECPGVASAEVAPAKERKPPTANQLSARPTARQRLKNYVDATAKWLTAGEPERTAEDQHVLADVCANCPTGDYISDPLLPIVMDGGQCGACGCGLKPERKLFNALRYATYKCKLGHWDELIAGGQVSYVEVPEPSKRDPDPDDGRAG